MSAFDWGTDDRYRSNNGTGQYWARILAVVGDTAIMENWRGRGMNGRRPKRFELPVRFLQSKSCGWRLQK